MGELKDDSEVGIVQVDEIQLKSGMDGWIDLASEGEAVRDGGG